MDIDHPYYHQFETNKAHWAADIWLRRHGITSQDLDTHPCIDDVITLLNIRESLWDRMNSKEQASWGAYWGMVYNKQKPLHQKFWKKFESIAINISQRELRQQIQRQLIKQHRTLQNKDHDNEAKGSDLARMLTDKSTNRGATMNLLPWE